MDNHLNYEIALILNQLCAYNNLDMHASNLILKYMFH